jgi:hypothetical protein
VTLRTSPDSSLTALADWEQVLSAYSAALDEHRSVLLAIEADLAAEYDVPPAPSFVPPPTMPPIPPELAAWAQTLMGTTRALVQLAAELATRSEPQRPSRPAHAAVANDATLDAFL